MEAEKQKMNAAAAVREISNKITMHYLFIFLAKNLVLKLTLHYQVLVKHFV